MSNLVIREFQSISRGIELSDFDFDALKSYVEGNDELKDVFTPCFDSGRSGISIKACNYVGMIQLASGSSLEILPKIDLDVNQSRRILMEMLSTVEEMPFRDSDESSVGLQDLPLLEFFIRFFIQCVWKVVRSSIAASYYDVEGNEPYLRGSLVFSEQIKNNFVHRELFYVRHQLYGQNRPENRLIKTSLIYLNKISHDSENRRELNTLLSYFENIPESMNLDLDFEKCRIDRGMEAYVIVMKWARILLKKQTFDIYHGENITFSILFPMETLYERYVAKKISMALNGLFDVVIQDETQSIFDEVRKICLRPDIVLYGPDKSPVILDTKWKALSSVSDISTSDLYQMIVYTAKYRSKEAFLLYPKNSLNETLVMHESFFEHDVSITAFFVDLNDIEGSLESLIHIIQHDC